VFDKSDVSLGDLGSAATPTPSSARQAVFDKSDVSLGDLGSAATPTPASSARQAVFDKSDAALGDLGSEATPTPASPARQTVFDKSDAKFHVAPDATAVIIDEECWGFDTGDVLDPFEKKPKMMVLQSARRDGASGLVKQTFFTPFGSIRLFSRTGFRSNFNGVKETKYWKFGLVRARTESEHRVIEVFMQTVGGVHVSKLATALHPKANTKTDMESCADMQGADTTEAGVVAGAPAAGHKRGADTYVAGTDKKQRGDADKTDADGDSSVTETEELEIARAQILAAKKEGSVAKKLLAQHKTEALAAAKAAAAQLAKAVASLAQEKVITKQLRADVGQCKKDSKAVSLQHAAALRHEATTAKQETKRQADAAKAARAELLALHAGELLRLRADANRLQTALLLQPAAPAPLGGLAVPAPLGGLAVPAPLAVPVPLAVPAPALPVSRAGEERVYTMGEMSLFAMMFGGRKN